MAAWRSNEPDFPLPPGTGEHEYQAARYGRGSNVQEDWTPDPAPVPPTPQEDIEW